jgi:3-phenylpropionate/trans-cinnamate dioxygenase ferredoxin reductase subunit
VHTLRTPEDAEWIRERLLPGAPVVVVGAGFIGAEVAASARVMGCDVTILEIAPIPLSRILGPEIGEIYTAIHRGHGVNMRTGTGLDEIVAGRRGEVGAVIDTTGARHDAAVVVIGVGLAPDTELAERSGVAVADGVTVDEHCETSVPGVFAAGDVARHPNPILGRSVRVEAWQNAQHQAAAAALNMLGRPTVFAEVPWFWSDQYDMNLQMAGMPQDCDEVVMRGEVDAGSFSVFYLSRGTLEGVVGINRPLDVRIGRRLIGQRARPPADVLRDELSDLTHLVDATPTGV